MKTSRIRLSWQAEPGEHEGHRGGEESRVSSTAGHGDDHRVEEVLGELALRPRVGVVVEREAAEREVAVLAVYS